MYSVLRRFFCSVDLSIRLLLGLSLLLLVGGIEARLHPAIFGRLNFQRFQDWFPTHDLESTWWVWLLFFLLTLFAINTAACTTERLLELVKNRHEQASYSFLMLLSPSIMHLCFLAIIGGHAISQFSAESREVPAQAATAIQLNSGVLKIIDCRCSYHREPGLAGLAKTCTAHLSFSTTEGITTRSVSLLQPILLDGFNVHLVMAGKTELGKIPAMKLVLRKDLGLGFILFGNLILCLLMTWYFPVIIRNRTIT
ncbi:MAG TPA: hypothetical protein PLI53_09650 [Geobacteraceae bacterium]|nr:hypothetical protein [Geobacteraceae bacterium]